MTQSNENNKGQSNECRKQKVELLHWPAQSPDLNLLEKLWVDVIKGVSKDNPKIKMNYGELCNTLGMGCRLNAARTWWTPCPDITKLPIQTMAIFLVINSISA